MNLRLNCHLIVASFLFCFVSATSNAAPVTVPPGLNLGDQYRLAFVTSQTRNGTSSNIADYNTFVTNSANGVPELAALGTTWKAIGSTSTVDARDNTGTNPLSTGVPIYRLDGIRIANNNPDLWDSFLANPISTDQTGATRLTRPYTGTLASGTHTATSALGRSNVEIGDSGYVSLTWIGGIDDSAVFPHSLYGMSGVLTVVTVVPEPSTTFLLGIGAISLLGYRKRTR